MTSKVFSNNIQCLLFNARSLCNKFTELDILIENSNFQIIFITETWLSNIKVFPADLNLTKKFNFVLSNRTSNQKGGGVAILISKNLNFSEISLVSKYQCEIAVISLASSIPTKIACVYRPPNCSSLNTKKLC